MKIVCSFAGLRQFLVALAAFLFALNAHAQFSSIWDASTVPGTVSANDNGAVELGVKFRATVDGSIHGIRFYKGSQNTGTHVGNLWSAGGTLLATATFAGETASGWQQVTFASPVAVVAGTTYVASYHTPTGFYAVDAGYFAGSGVDNGPLRALADGEDGGNGVYLYGAGGFPTFTWNTSNYWVDVVFSPAVDTTPPGVTISAPADGSLSNNSSVTVTGTLDEAASVEVNGGAAVVTGTSFTATNVPLTEGSNTLTATATDSAGNVGTTSVNVTLDTGVPVVGISSPADGSVLASSPVEVTGTVDDATASVEVNGVVAVVTGNTYTATGVPLTEGPNTLTATATDAAGNVGTTSVGVTFDTGAPVVGISSPADESVLTNSLVTVTGTVDDPAATVDVNGVAAVVSNTTYTASDVPLTEGANTLTATATDGSGNVGTVSVNVTLDTGTPVVGITSPADGSELNQSPVTVTGTVSDISAVSVDVNGVAAAVTGNTYTATGVSLAEGANTLTATATDAVGNVGTASVGVTLTPPPSTYSIWDASAIPGTVSANDNGAVELGVKFRATVDGSIHGIRFYKGSQNTGTHVGNLWSAGGALLATATFAGETASGWQQVTFASPVAVVAGTTYVASYHTPTGFYAADAGYFSGSGVDNGPLRALADGEDGGNGLYRYGAGGFPTFTWNAANYWVDVVFSPAVDTTPPAVTISAPADGSVSNNSPVTVTGTLDEAASVEVNGVVAVVTGSTYTATGVPLTEGPNTLTATATDSAGNVGTTSVNVTLDTGVPVVGISSPADGSVLASSPVEVTGTVDDATASVEVNGVVAVVTGNTYTATGVPLTEGPNTLTATATDAAGNVGTTSVGVTFDTGAPVVGISSPADESVLTNSLVTVTGTVDDPAATVDVNGVAAVVSNTTYTASDVPLTEGANTLTATATDGSGNVGTVSVNVTLDTGAPIVVSVSPANGTANVASDAVVAAVFNEPMDSQSINSSNFEVRDAGGGLVAATVSYDAVTVTATLTPSAPLPVGETYTVTVQGGPGGVVDAADNSMASDFSWGFTTTASGPCAVPANDIVAENCLPGNPPSEWDVGLGDSSIQGYATDISVNQGETVSFKVDTAATDYRLDIYRIGYYGGLGARLVATVEPSVSLPQTQPSCLNDAATGLVDCGNWTESASWVVPATAVSGVYIAKLTGEDGVTGNNHIIFVVRDDDGGSALLFQTSDTTWQAYNDYGGNSLYVGSPDGRAYAVSYNRPFNTRNCCIEDWFFNAEYPMVRWLEANGYDVSYFTGVDTDRFGAELLEHQAFLSVGHDEYWSGDQRSNVEAARDAGVHLAFFSGNEVYWKTRWESSIDATGTPYRTLVSYKETEANAKIDPLPGVWTGTWRDPRFSPPADGGRPENELTGTLFTVNGYRSDAITVSEDFGKLRFWRDTAIADLSPGGEYTLPDGTLGYEWDEYIDNGYLPTGLIRLSSTTVSGVPLLQDYGNTYARGDATHSLTLYRAGSGALVFGAGTVQWSWGLDSEHDLGSGITDDNMRQATVNLFADMGVQPNTLQSGLVAATQSSDVTPPVSTITQPSDGATLTVGQAVTITGTAVDGEGLVGAVEVSIDGGVTWSRASGLGNWSYTWTPVQPGAVTIMSSAVDDSVNLETSAAAVSVTVEVASTQTSSIWDASAVPGTVSANDNGAVELGVKFRATVDGSIHGIRFYKGLQNTGTHVGNLWSAGGALLATATFAGETASGWQQVTFASPVAVVAGTTYVASYHTPTGFYAADAGYFAGSGVDNGPLRALADGEDGSNGVYLYGAGGFPTFTWNTTNYWVDVVFSPAVDTTPPVVTITAPADGSVSNNSAVTVTGTLDEAASVEVNGVVAVVTGSTYTATGVPLTEGPNTLTATATDSAGNVGTTSVGVTFDTGAPVVGISSPADGSVLASSPVEVTGTVDDPAATVDVNGVAAVVSNTTYTASDVPLTEGANTLTATATDGSGNVGTVSVNVTLDTGTPVVGITSPADGSELNQSPVTVTGTVSDVSAVSVDVNGVAAAVTGNTYTATGVSLTEGSNTLTATATDAVGNVGTASVGVTLTPPPSTYSIWDASAIPGTVSANDNGAVELGVKFRATVDGSIHGIRFYKGSQNTGTHVGNLWSAGGTLLATATFAGETASGWQQVTFASPVAVVAGTTYVASYHTPTGFYAVDAGYFAGSGVDNGPLRALADGEDGSNGVYLYGAGGFPTFTWNSGNYWVDVVFSSATPLVTITTPANGSVLNNSSVTVTGTVDDAGAVVDVNGVLAEVTGTTYTATNVPLTEGPNTLTVTATNTGGNAGTASVNVTFDTGAPVVAISTPVDGSVLGASPVTVTGTVVDEGTTTVEVNGVAALVTGTTYTATGVPLTEGSNTLTVTATDAVGNVGTSSVAVELDSSLVSLSPILLIESAGNAFSAYYREILQAEGFNYYEVVDIADATASMLSNYGVVILGEMPLSAADVAMFDDWVNAGGKLIAMRPDAQLLGLLGLTSTASTLAEGYLLVDTTVEPGLGIVGETIQYHGEADLYTLNGASSVATLYSDAFTPMASPAVAIRDVGANGGQAAVFAYDLAKTVVYTRQGNPAWAGQERDGASPIRSSDLFFGDATGDPQPDWTNLDKVAIPQADEQQRLLGNLLTHMTADRVPMPRFWYFPRSEKAVVIMTGDDHGNNGTEGQFNTFIGLSSPGCLVDDWECIRGTSYIFPSTPISDAIAAGFEAVGFEIGVHVDTGCSDYTPTTLPFYYDNDLAAFDAVFPSLLTPVTNRTHCIVWSDYVTQAQVAVERGIRFDTNYYYWPSFWIQGRVGFMTGSGMPMRFADENGVTIDVYQAATQMTDESGQSYPFTIDTLLDRALGVEGYYGAFVANMHTDFSSHPEAEAIVASAQARGVPVVTSRQMLEWLDGKDLALFNNLGYRGDVVTFSVSSAASANGLTAMLPVKWFSSAFGASGGSISTLERNGAPISFSTEVIKGVEYAIFDGFEGAYTATYAPAP